MNCTKTSIALMALWDGTILHAQSSEALVTPKPTQLAAAKTVFISNNTIGNAEGSEFLYAHLYRAIQKLNRFEIVLAPPSADLILEYSISDVVGPTLLDMFTHCAYLVQNADHLMVHERIRTGSRSPVQH
jgi:hypothetical protein